MDRVRDPRTPGPAIGPGRSAGAPGEDRAALVVFGPDRSAFLNPGLLTAALLPVVLIGCWVAADAVQSDRFSPVRQTISVAAGYTARDRWIMTAGLWAVAMLFGLTAAAADRLPGRARGLLAVSAICGAGVAACPQPVRGSSAVHLTWAALGAVTLAVTPGLASIRGCGERYGWAYRPMIGWAVTAGFLCVLGWVLFEAAGGLALGLAERVETSSQVCWPAMLVACAPPPRRSALGGHAASRRA